MTECERFIDEGRFDADFFNPEMRCDFLVTRKMKKIWAVQIDLFLQFERVCARHGLKYFAAGGTLLGACRHNGYIPWDDDMDIYLPRPDYMKLQECADEFEDPYFLQMPGRDEDYFYSFSKLRNSRTTQASATFSHRAFNQGVCIDIIPLDKWTTKKGEAAFNRINEINIDNSNYLRQGMMNPSAKDLERIRAWSGTPPAENLQEIDRLATQFNEMRAPKIITAAVTTLYPHDTIQFPAKAFESARKFPFENIEMTVPIGYESILTTQYGDWRRLPPANKRGAWHSSLLIDPDVPYRQFLDDYRKSNGKIH